MGVLPAVFEQAGKTLNLMVNLGAQDSCSLRQAAFERKSSGYREGAPLVDRFIAFSS